ncbi:MAG: ChaN family lipoprotein [Elainellaceae cyanobacterium]
MTVPVSRWRLGCSALSIALLLTVPAACSIADELPTASVPLTLSSEAADLAPLLVDVVYLGERHDSAEDHAAQLEIIQALYAEDPNMAIALEMFQRPFQPVLDRYLAGEISEAALVAQSEYEQRWGFPWEYYAPILQFAQAHQLPVLALNAPSEVVRQVAREGLGSLQEQDFRYIPPLDQLDTSGAEYREFVGAAFGGHGDHGSFDFENFFAAQVVWDETMAATVASFKRASPETRVVVLAGSGHVMYGYGIPSRVARRLEGQVGEPLQQTTVLINPPEALAASEDAADVFWRSE